MSDSSSGQNVLTRPHLSFIFISFFSNYIPVLCSPLMTSQLDPTQPIFPPQNNNTTTNNLITQCILRSFCCSSICLPDISHKDVQNTVLKSLGTVPLFVTLPLIGFTGAITSSYLQLLGWLLSFCIKIMCSCNHSSNRIRGFFVSFKKQYLGILFSCVL